LTHYFQLIGGEVEGKMSVPHASPPADYVSGFGLAPPFVSPSDLERFLPEFRPRPSLLAVSSDSADQFFLKQTFPEATWELHEARSYRAAVAILCYERMPVVICQCSVPDGNWKDVLGQTAVLPNAPRLLVTSPDPDEHLWAEVLNMGGYDVLATPFDRDELIRVVDSARRSWETEWSRMNQRWARHSVFAQVA
jgi:DNA-binding NtrC family response regulator